MSGTGITAEPTKESRFNPTTPEKCPRCKGRVAKAGVKVWRDESVGQDWAEVTCNRCATKSTMINSGPYPKEWTLKEVSAVKGGTKKQREATTAINNNNNNAGNVKTAGKGKGKGFGRGTTGTGNNKTKRGGGNRTRQQKR